MTPDLWQVVQTIAAAVGSIAMAVMYGLWYAEHMRKIRQ